MRRPVTESSLHQAIRLSHTGTTHSPSAAEQNGRVGGQGPPHAVESTESPTAMRNTLAWLMPPLVSMPWLNKRFNGAGAWSWSSHIGLVMSTALSMGIRERCKTVAQPPSTDGPLIWRATQHSSKGGDVQLVLAVDDASVTSYPWKQSVTHPSVFACSAPCKAPAKSVGVGVKSAGQGWLRFEALVLVCAQTERPTS